MPEQEHAVLSVGEENMKAATRPVLAAFVASAAVLWSVAIHAPAAHARAVHVRWDIATFSGPPSLILGPGGADSALANNSTGITLTGSGTFVAPAGGAGTSSAVTGGGTWQTFDNMSTPTGGGTYQVTGLVRWDKAPGNLDGLTDAIAPNETPSAGLAVLRIRYSDGEEGVLTVSCAIAASPPTIFEGITASKGYVDYFNRVPGFTLFHELR
jgi:hypothetical protein